MAYLNKTEAFEYVSSRYPRGADVGTKVYYLDSTTRQRVEFCVAAEQVWRTDRGERVMGLVWSGVCSVCKEGFFQASPTHPKELNERCPFCCSQRYDTYNVRDVTMFNPKRTTPRIGVKRRGSIENLILEIGTSAGGTINVDALIEKAVANLLPPGEGKRDTRYQSVVRSITGLNREKDGPLRLEGKLAIFYE